MGPRTRRSKHLYKETSHLFAPKDVSIYIVAPKTDVYGLGFSEKHRLGSSSSSSKRTQRSLVHPFKSPEKRSITLRSNTGTRTTNHSRLSMSSGNIGTAHRNGFGLGAFEARDQIDDIYGDEDDMSNYNRAIDAVRKKFAHTCIITR